jgi:sugar phosphate permease
MKLPSRNIFYGWFVVFGCAFVVFGVAGGQFSFGVFLKPMTEDFGWSRATLSLAFGVTFMISGLLRPLAGYLADRYSAKWAALCGVVVMGVMLLLLPLVDNLFHLYLIFGVMSIGITLGTGPILTKVVSEWFLVRRGLTMGLVSGAGSFGAMILVPASSVFLVLFDWQQAYLFLGLLLLVLVLPVGAYFIRDRPQDMGLEPYGDPKWSGSPAGSEGDDHPVIVFRDATFREALCTPLFQRLTFGYFV